MLIIKETRLEKMLKCPAAYGIVGCHFLAASNFTVDSRSIWTSIENSISNGLNNSSCQNNSDTKISECVYMVLLQVFVVVYL